MSVTMKIFMICFLIFDLQLVSVLPFTFALNNKFVKIFLLDADSSLNGSLLRVNSES